jgi:hypothetical protein
MSRSGKGQRISLAIRSRQLHVVDPAIAQIRSRRASVLMAQEAGAVGQEIDPGDQQEWLPTSEVFQEEIRDPISCAAEHARA